MKQVKKENGITAGQLVLAVTVTSIVMVALGLFLLPYEKILALYAILPASLGDLSIHFGLFVVLGFVYCLVFYTQVLDAPLWKFGVHLRKQHNNSQVIMFVSMFAVAALPIVFAGGTNINEWFFLTLLKSALSHVLGMMVQIFIARSIGVRTLDRFKEWLEQDSNDSHAILSGGMYVLTTLLVSVLPLAF